MCCFAFSKFSSFLGTLDSNNFSKVDPYPIMLKVLLGGKCDKTSFKMNMNNNIYLRM